MHGRLWSSSCSTTTPVTCLSDYASCTLRTCVKSFTRLCWSASRLPVEQRFLTCFCQPFSHLTHCVLWSVCQMIALVLETSALDGARPADHCQTENGFHLTSSSKRMWCVQSDNMTSFGLTRVEVVCLACGSLLVCTGLPVRVVLLSHTMHSLQPPYMFRCAAAAD